ncbi:MULTISPECIES: pyridoxamine 5'-phosphate oxidase family protein [unclassified Achromobacter]|uniref:2Fe-2S iron-sulfur cluster-binding protein n=1 Tax=unclassified Achromobacter TaxID=2626865 RepID=UPI000B517714|nr:MULTISPECIES: pyridoxamine 5'-phosphate oxidase family protein [unclassified Achromobacter]OWT80224.1 FAD-binding oxidoreductase [Achromobacter sp. HZ34]OWT82107.1 FAD-binding oxidoreductase [Achromobacter sp. HZ28]
MSTSLPWHAGELAMQTRVGVLAKMDDVGRRFVRDYMPDQHREFFEQLPFVVLGTVARDGTAWATLRAGLPGFLASPDARRLDVAIARESADPADEGLADGDAVGMLGIDLATRRRNRMNGVLRHTGGSLSHIDVVHSYGNCPRYIHQRAVTYTRDPAVQTAIPAQTLDALDDEAKALIGRSDAFFVASYVDLPDQDRQVDVSHRGGKPGFVRLDDDGGMTIPDFNGNLFFNTLGNFLVNPKAGVTFADFETGELLQMTGRAEVIVDSPEIAAFQGAERLWRFFPQRIVRRRQALPLQWARDDQGASPAALLTGSWDDAANRLRAAELATKWRPFKVTRIVDESSVVRSFHLEPADGAGRLVHQAGQFLPIRVTLPGQDKPAIRTYTLSVAPSDANYRISVKRDGAVSRYLHDHVKVGDLLDTRAPGGAFTIDATEKRPAVLLAAGIGVTPMLAMLRHVVYEGKRRQRTRPVWFFHSARSLQERAFADELALLQEQGQGAVHVVRLLSDLTDAQRSRDYDESGRIDMDVLRARLPFDDYDFYLCGPGPFMQAIYDGLRALNVADDRIHAEAFGASSLTRQGNADAGAGATAGKATPGAAAPAAAPATKSVPVMFMDSVKEARWNPGDGSLLELAEQRGLSPEYGCREGNCGSCRTRILQGAVAYTKAPQAAVGADEALICCAVPAAHDVPLHLAL